MLLLPTFNATLQPCSVGPAAFTAHEQGHFCGSCQRVVQDFSRAADPVGALAAARAAAPDGRVCGRFAAGQVQTARPRLTRRLQWFVLALVLVVGQGLTARQALAQVCQPGAAAPRPQPLPGHKMGKVVAAPAKPAAVVYGAVSEEMPGFRGGSLREVGAYIKKQLRRPSGAKTNWVEGTVYVRFTVGADGRVREAAVLKGLHLLLDAEVLRVIRTLDGFTPGWQQGQPVAVSMVVPITFKWK